LLSFLRRFGNNAINFFHRQLSTGLKCFNDIFAVIMKQYIPQNDCQDHNQEKHTQSSQRTVVVVVEDSAASVGIGCGHVVMRCGRSSRAHGGELPSLSSLRFRILVFGGSPQTRHDIILRFAVPYLLLATCCLSAYVLQLQFQLNVIE